MKFIYMKAIFLIITVMFLISCQQQENKPLQGYMDADYTYVSSSFSGNLIQLSVSRGRSVTKGQDLFILDAQPEQSQLQNAEAHVVEATAKLKKQEIELTYQTALLKRYQKLIKTSGVSQEEFDKINNQYQNAQASLKSYQGNLQASLAELEKAKWSKSSKTINAPISGYVYDTYYTVGELVPVAKPVVSLVAPENLKVVFYISEPLLAKIRLQQEVNIICDGCATSIPALISYISSQNEYTPPNIYSEDTRTKFIYRIEAKPNKSAFMQLHPGQPVSVKLMS